jgi:hypothetical protein
MGVEGGNRFIRQDELRLLHYGACDGDALLLTTGEGIGALQGLWQEVQTLQGPEGEGTFGGGETLHQRRERPVVV